MTVVMDYEAWERGRDASIKANASKSRNRRWIAGDQSRAEVEKFLFSWHGTDSFLGAMAEAVAEWGHLSEKQEAAVRKIMADSKEREASRAAARDAEHAAAAPCPSGRTQITGTIISTDLRENAFGTQWKMLVRDDSGFKVWGSIPEKLFELCADGDLWPHGRDLKGKQITFHAAVEVSEKDSKFGFFKRPTKTALRDGGVS